MRSQSRVVFAIVAVVAIALVAACGSDSKKPKGSSGSDKSSASAAAGNGKTMPVRAFFLRDGKVGVTGRTIPTTKTPANAAMNQLLSGPNQQDTSAGLSTAIPTGTKNNGVKIDNKTATVDLSQQFQDPGNGSMQSRIAQVVYTLTQFPSVTGVLFKIDGKAVDKLGADGVPVDKPQTRADWESQTPAILVATPLPYDKVKSPVHVVGTANTFEATFKVKITDSTGAVLTDTSVKATSGSGTRGTFDQAITFTGGKPGTLTMTFYEASAQDGTPTNVVNIPVTLNS
jgi:hypothetical protein